MALMSTCMCCNKVLHSGQPMCETCYSKQWHAVILEAQRDEADEYYAELKARLDERAPA